MIDKREHIGGNCYDYIDEHGESVISQFLNNSLVSCKNNAAVQVFALPCMECTYSIPSMTGSRSMSASSQSGFPMSTGWWPRQRISRFVLKDTISIHNDDVYRVTPSLSPCPPISRLSTCCLELTSPRRKRWWPGSTRGDPQQVR